MHHLLLQRDVSASTSTGYALCSTSKTCSRCGHKQAMPLWVRTYRCANCGLVMNRDENSAVNINQQFLAGLRPHTDDAVRCADVFTAIEHRCAAVSTATDQCVHPCEHI